MVTSNDLSCATISLMRMIRSRTPLIPMSLVDENCIIKVLARALSEVANYSSMAFRSGLTL